MSNNLSNGPSNRSSVIAPGIASAFVATFDCAGATRKGPPGGGAVTNLINRENSEPSLSSSIVNSLISSLTTSSSGAVPSAQRRATSRDSKAAARSRMYTPTADGTTSFGGAPFSIAPTINSMHAISLISRAIAIVLACSMSN